MRTYGACAAAGPPDTDSIPPAERPGILWELYRELAADGWSLDAFSYTTNFRFVACLLADALLLAC